MARRKKDGLVDAVVDATALLPWWGGVALALISYVWLRSVGQQPLETMQPGQSASFVGSAMWRAFSVIGQYLLPFLFLLGAGISGYRRHRAKLLHADAANRADGMVQMSWREFEVMVGEYFRRLGFSVVENGGGGPDGGVDLILQKGSDRYLVQCKQWRALRVGVQPVRELYGVMASRRIAGAFVVTSGDFTDEARSFAEGREIRLINGKALQRGIRAQAATAGTLPQPLAAESSTASASQRNPMCPLCGSQMVVRQARAGNTPGKNFWGCGQFAQTKCRGTRELEH